MPLDLPRAATELRAKTYQEIQGETAWLWASRAAVSYQAIASGPAMDLISLWVCAQEYEHEALEHAALVDDGGELLKGLTLALQPYKRQAETLLGKVIQP